MEALYSSVPEANDSMKRFVVFSVSVILCASLIWYLNKKMKRINENCNLR
jgi:hypothetical protein